MAQYTVRPGSTIVFEVGKGGCPLLLKFAESSVEITAGLLDTDIEFQRLTECHPRASVVQITTARRPRPDGADSELGAKNARTREGGTGLDRVQR